MPKIPNDNLPIGYYVELIFQYWKLDIERLDNCLIRAGHSYIHFELLQGYTSKEKNKSISIKEQFCVFACKREGKRQEGSWCMTLLEGGKGKLGWTYNGQQDFLDTHTTTNTREQSFKLFSSVRVPCSGTRAEKEITFLIPFFCALVARSDSR